MQEENAMKRKWVAGLLALSLTVGNVMPVNATELDNATEVPREEVVQESEKKEEENPTEANKTEEKVEEAVEKEDEAEPKTDNTEKEEAKKVKAVNADDIVEIPDATLKNALVYDGLGTDENGDGELSKAEMETIEKISLYNWGSENKPEIDLTGIEYAVNVKELQIKNYEVKNYEKLLSLVNLETLDIDGGGFSDFEMLAKFPKLTVLNLANNGIADISGLSGLTNLKDLDLCENEITDISKISGLTKLEDLTLYANNISNISVLSKLVNLKALWLSGNNISDISALKSLTKLKSLDLSENPVQNLEVLGDLSNLNGLWLERMGITDVAFVKNLKQLERITLCENDISDISPFVGMFNDNNYGGFSQWIELQDNPKITKESAFADLYPVQERHLLEGMKQEVLVPGWLSNFSFSWGALEEADITFESENPEIVEVTEDKALMPKAIGRTNVVAKVGDTTRRFPVVVEGQKPSVPIEAEKKPNVETVCEKVSAILNPNHELWSVNTEKKEKVAEDVQSYLADEVNGHSERNCWGEYFVLDSNDTLWRYFKSDYEGTYQKTEIAKNVLSYSETAFVTKDNQLYDIWTKSLIHSNVKKYDNNYGIKGGKELSPYILTNDGQFMNLETKEVYATGVKDVIYDIALREAAYAYIDNNDTLHFCQRENSSLKTVGSVANVKEVDDKLITKTDGSTWEWTYEWDVNYETGIETGEILCEKITSNKILQNQYGTLLDENHSLWESDGEMTKGSTSYKKIADNVKKICKRSSYFIGNDDKLYDTYNLDTAIASDIADVDEYFYLKTDGSLWRVKEIGEDYPNSSDYADGVQVLTDVTDFYEELWVCSPMKVNVVRKDGSVWSWRFSGNVNNAPVMITDPLVMKGDVSEEGQVDIDDVQLLFASTSRRKELTETQKKVADVNGDGNIDITDVQRLFQYASKRIDTL